MHLKQKYQVQKYTYREYIYACCTRCYFSR